MILGITIYGIAQHPWIGTFVSCIYPVPQKGPWKDLRKGIESRKNKPEKMYYLNSEKKLQTNWIEEMKEPENFLKTVAFILERRERACTEMQVRGHRPRPPN